MSYTGDDGPWLTISEAAKLTGRNIDAMRALVRRGRVPRRKGNKGEWLVQVPQTLPQADSGIDSHSVLDTARDRDSDTKLQELRDQVAELRIALARAEGRLEGTEARLADRDRELGEVKAERDRLLEMMAEAQASLTRRNKGMLGWLRDWLISSTK